MPSVVLNQTASVKLNGAGNGTAKVGPLSAREIWHPQTAAVSCTFLTGQTAPVSEATCVISVGDSYTQKFRDSCVDGSSGDATGRIDADVIKNGEYVWAVWTGGDAGTTATLTVTGTKDV